MPNPRSYLDDPEFEWTLEETIPGKDNLNNLIAELHERDEPEERLAIILQGYAGLKQRHPELSDAQLLMTSMVWMYG